MSILTENMRRWFQVSSFWFQVGMALRSLTKNLKLETGNYLFAALLLLLMVALPSLAFAEWTIEKGGRICYL